LVASGEFLYTRWRWAQSQLSRIFENCSFGHETYVREQKSCFHNFDKTLIPTNRNKCHVPGISTTPCGSRKKFPIHENKLNIQFHINPCKHFTTTHVLSFSFDRMSFFQARPQLGLRTLNTPSRLRMKQDLHQLQKYSGPNICIATHLQIIRVISSQSSVMRSDHSAVVAYAERPKFIYKTSINKVFRPVSPAQNALFLQHLSDKGFCDYEVNSTTEDTQADFNAFYEAALQLLNRFYPERLISVTSRDPYYITPAIKSKLRRKNRLSRAGRIEEWNALAQRIGKDIAARNITRLSRINHKKCATDMWAAVRQLTRRRHKDEVCDGITAETLNQHYTQISTDTAYQRPPRKLTATHRDEDIIIIIKTICNAHIVIG